MVWSWFSLSHRSTDIMQDDNKPATPQFSHSQRISLKSNGGGVAEGESVISQVSHKMRFLLVWCAWPLYDIVNLLPMNVVTQPKASPGGTICGFCSFITSVQLNFIQATCG